MIKFIKGNLLESDAEALVNTVNTVGVMGKGIALQFKNQFPENFKVYSKACKNSEFNIGDLLITEENSLLHNDKRIIINFPTKTDWRKPSEYSYIEKGLVALVEYLKKSEIKSIAIPPLGAGHGGLKWEVVRKMMEFYFRDFYDKEIIVYQPNDAIEEILKKERVKLTPARAMLLAVLFDLVKNGEFVSEFAAEKVAYFLQRFGAEKDFKLKFQPNFYGPYSSKVKHVLYYLNGSYITGYSSKDKKPFEEIGIKLNTEIDVIQFLSLPENNEYLDIVNNTKYFLEGYYSNFALELLSSVDFIMTSKKISDPEVVAKELYNWSERKKTLFNNDKFVIYAVKNISTNLRNVH